MITDRICQSINRWLFETSVEKGPLRKVALLHVSKETNTGHEVTDWTTKTDDPSAVQVPTLVASILETAQEDADGWGGVQSYVVAGYFGTDANDGGRTVVFPVHSTRRDSNDIGAHGIVPTEPATERGLAATAMRHSEGLHKLLVQGFGQAIESLGRQNAAKDHLIERMLEKHMDTVVQVENLLDKKAERDLAAQREAIKVRNMDIMMTTALPLLPALLNKLVFNGMSVLREDVSPEMEQIRLLVGSLNETQINKIAEALEPSQGIAFMMFYEKMREKTKEMEAKKAADGKPNLQIVKTS